MTVPKLPIAHHWIEQTLIPFLLYAFASTLPYPADISTQVESAINFCRTKPDHPSDGNDLVFERIFMAVMHRHKNLAPDLEMVVEHLEPLTKYLIRRAQLKGPYELLGRTDIASGAWVAHERHRLEGLVLTPNKAKYELRPPVRPPASSKRSPPAEGNIDPRLIYTQPGQFVAKSISAQLTSEEDASYRRQNHEFEQHRLRRQQQRSRKPAVRTQATNSSCNPSGRSSTNMPITYGSSYELLQEQVQQPTAPTSVNAQQELQQHAISRRQSTPSLQSYPQLQTLKPQLPFSSVLPDTAHVQLYSTKQRLPPKLQSFQFSPNQYQSIQSPAHPPEAHHQPTEQHCHLPTFPTLLSQTSPPHKPPVPLHPAPAPTWPTKAATSSDFAYPRGTKWSITASQRAREIAAKASAYERDVMARSIIQRQQFIVQASPVPDPTGSMHSSKRHMQGMPTPPQAASAHFHASHVSNAIHSWPAAADNRKRGAVSQGTALLTLEQVRGRLGREQQQGLSLAMTKARPEPCGPQTSQALPSAAISQNPSTQQVRPPLPSMMNFMPSLSHQLPQVASANDRVAFSTAPCGELPFHSPCLRGTSVSGPSAGFNSIVSTGSLFDWQPAHPKPQHFLKRPLAEPLSYDVLVGQSRRLAADKTQASIPESASLQEQLRYAACSEDF